MIKGADRACLKDGLCMLTPGAVLNQQTCRLAAKQTFSLEHVDCEILAVMHLCNAMQCNDVPCTAMQ